MKVTLHSQEHEWRARGDDGRVRYVRASWDSREWHFIETYKDLPDWAPVVTPALEDYEGLRDVLWRKYQRRRVPVRFVELVDAILAKMRPPPEE